jgi:hypothetical protein
MVPRATARRLCTDREYAVVEASFGARSLAPAVLRRKIVSARNLRDKYRDLGDRQRLAERGKAPGKPAREPSRTGNTAKKEQLFQEALDRLQKAAPATAAEPAGPARKATKAGTRTAKRAPKKAAARKVKKSAAKKAARKAGGEDAPSRPAAKAKGGRVAGAGKAGSAAGAGGKAGSAAGAGGKAGKADRAAGAGKKGATMTGSTAKRGVRGPSSAKKQGKEQTTPTQRVAAKNAARGKMARGHTKSAQGRTQTRRDGRN